MAITHLEDRRQRTSAPELPVSWIRPRQFAQATGMAQRTVYDELTSGRLRGIRVGKSYFIRAEEVEAFFARHGRPAA